MRSGTRPTRVTAVDTAPTCRSSAWTRRPIPRPRHSRGPAARPRSTGKTRRDFIYVDDVNRFHLLCLRDHRTDGMTLNVGTGENYSVLDVYEEIAEQLGSSVRPVFRTDLAGEAQETLADTTAARTLGFVPEVGLKEGLARSIQHLRSIAMSQEPQP